MSLDIRNVITGLKADFHGSHLQFLKNTNTLICHMRLLKLELQYENRGSVDSKELFTTSINLHNKSLRATHRDFTSTIASFTSEVEKLQKAYDALPFNEKMNTLSSRIDALRENIDGMWEDSHRVLAEAEEF